MAIATYEDANLILRLYELRTEPGMRAARTWFIRNARFQSIDDMKHICPPGSEENAFFRQVTTYWDMAAGFVANGILHADLFFQSGRELLLVWVRIRNIVPELRKANHDPIAYRNLEEVAEQYIEWLNRASPETFNAFAERVK